MPAQFELDEDDLAETAQPAATIHPTTTHNTDLDQAPAPVINSQSLDWGTAKPISLSDGLDRIRSKTGEVVRFAIIPDSSPQMDKVHYVSLAGKPSRYFVCAGVNCPACKSGDVPKTTIVALAAQYLNADPMTGNLADDTAPIYKVGYINLSASAFNGLLGALVGGNRPTDVDFAMSFDGRRYIFQVIAPTARHIHRRETAQIVLQAKPFEDRLRGKLGYPMPVNAALSAVPPIAEGMAHR